VKTVAVRLYETSETTYHAIVEMITAV